VSLLRISVIKPQDVVDVEFEFSADMQDKVKREIIIYSNDLISIRKIKTFVKYVSTVENGILKYIELMNLKSNNYD
jgi:hypothetical protein